MPHIAPKYSDDQRSAIGETGAKHPHLTAREISDRAAAGDLELDGAPVEAFTVPPASVRTIRARHLRSATARARALVADQAPADAVEELRRRLLAVADAALASQERRVRRGKATSVGGEDLRQIARAVREIAAIPGPEGSPRQARRPGDMIPGTTDNDGGPTRGGLAGAVMASLRPSTPALAPVDGALPPPVTGGETPSDSAHATAEHEQSERINAEDGGGPGSFARDAIAALSPPGAGAP